MREIVHLQIGQSGNQIGTKVSLIHMNYHCMFSWLVVLFAFLSVD